MYQALCRIDQPHRQVIQHHPGHTKLEYRLFQHVARPIPSTQRY